MNKTFSKTVLSVLNLLSVSFMISQSALADTAPVLRSDRVIRPLPGRLPLPPIDLRCRVDPAAVDLKFQVLRRTSRFRGVVQVTALVKNLGRSNYLSGPHQQALYLYEDNRLVAKREFTTLASGAELSLAYRRNWDASSPAEGEFPPTYKLMIAYDPDIAIDGNPNNDDCRLGNNRLQKSGVLINQLFR